MKLTKDEDLILSVFRFIIFYKILKFCMYVYGKKLTIIDIEVINYYFKIYKKENFTRDIIHQWYMFENVHNHQRKSFYSDFLSDESLIRLHLNNIYFSNYIFYRYHK